MTKSGRKDLFTKATYLRDSLLYIEAKGKLDIYNAPYYLDEIKEHLGTHYVKEIVLEFSEISFVASIGLRSILELYKLLQEKKCNLKLKNVNEEVMHAFEISGFDSFLTIENDSDNQELMQDEKTDS